MREFHSDPQYNDAVQSIAEKTMIDAIVLIKAAESAAKNVYNADAALQEAISKRDRARLEAQTALAKVQDANENSKNAMVVDATANLADLAAKNVLCQSLLAESLRVVKEAEDEVEKEKNRVAVVTAELNLASSEFHKVKALAVETSDDVIRSSQRAEAAQSACVVVEDVERSYLLTPTPSDNMSTTVWLKQILKYLNTVDPNGYDTNIQAMRYVFTNGIQSYSDYFNIFSPSASSHVAISANTHVTSSVFVKTLYTHGLFVAKNNVKEMREQVGRKMALARRAAETATKVSKELIDLENAMVGKTTKYQQVNTDLLAAKNRLNVARTAYQIADVNAYNTRGFYNEAVHKKNGVLVDCPVFVPQLDPRMLDSNMANIQMAANARAGHRPTFADLSNAQIMLDAVEEVTNNLQTLCTNAMLFYNAFYDPVTGQHTSSRVSMPPPPNYTGTMTNGEYDNTTPNRRLARQIARNAANALAQQEALQAQQEAKVAFANAAYAVDSDDSSVESANASIRKNRKILRKTRHELKKMYDPSDSGVHALCENSVADSDDTKSRRSHRSHRSHRSTNSSRSSGSRVSNNPTQGGSTTTQTLVQSLLGGSSNEVASLGNSNTVGLLTALGITPLTLTDFASLYILNPSVQVDATKSFANMVQGDVVYVPIRVSESITFQNGADTILLTMTDSKHFQKSVNGVLDGVLYDMDRNNNVQIGDVVLTFVASGSLVFVVNTIPPYYN